MTHITLQTNRGSITLELFDTLAPKTVQNFLSLAEKGFYNGVKFHRVIAGFMIQSGDPLSKDDVHPEYWGTGGPEHTFEDEIHAENNNSAGTIAMANRGPNTNGSQFFINVKDNHFLDTKHTVFGKVIEGMSVVHDIEMVPVGGGDRPVHPVIIEQVIVG